MGGHPGHSGGGNGNPSANLSSFRGGTKRPLANRARYEILEEIGAGGMGVVYRVRDTDLRRDIVLKTPKRRGPVLDEEIKQRFLEEASITAQLQHPGIPPVHEIGTLPDGRPFLTMKLVKGQTLADLLKSSQRSAISGQPDNIHDESVTSSPLHPFTFSPPDLPRFLRYFEQICETLAYAHDRGVIHRDLKPNNIMIGQFGEVQVMDWGLAKKVGSGQWAVDSENKATAIESPRAAAADRTAGALGTWSYMAPEQARGQVERVDQRSDVFGLGAILCEILTGQPPYTPRGARSPREQAENADVAAAHAQLDGCGADRDLIALAKGCLTADREARPASAGDVAKAMATYQAGVQEKLRRAELEKAQAQVKAIEEKRRRRWIMTAAAAVVLLVAGGGAAALWYQDDVNRQEKEAAVRKAEQDHRLVCDRGRIVIVSFEGEPSHGIRHH